MNSSATEYPGMILVMDFINTVIDLLWIEGELISVNVGKLKG